MLDNCMPYTLAELEEIFKKYFSDDGMNVFNKLKELVMTKVVIIPESGETKISEEATACWSGGFLYITKPNYSLVLSQREAQNLMNYLEGKRPKVVWE